MTDPDEPSGPKRRRSALIEDGLLPAPKPAVAPRSSSRRAARSPGEERPPRPVATPMDLALRWLKIRDRSEVELRRKFREKGVEPEQVDATIEKLKGLDLLSDTRFAAGRAGSLVRGGRYGPRAVKAKLTQAGVARGTVDGAVTEAMSTRDELEMARTALQKKHPLSIGTKDQKLRAKAVRFLLGRGFNANVVSKALQVEIELDRDDEPSMSLDE